MKEMKSCSSYRPTKESESVAHEKAELKRKADSIKQARKVGVRIFEPGK